MNRIPNATEFSMSKVPEVTLGFWIIKILATTLGETGGDTVSMTMDLGYLAGTAIFLAVLVVLVVAQIAANKFHPLLYWATIVASTTVGTTLADLPTAPWALAMPVARSFCSPASWRCSARGIGRKDRCPSTP